MDKNNRETEKSLKRFLKKKIAYTAGLLVAFLISGSVGFATSEELATQVAATHDTLIANIEAQKAEVQALLDENEARLRQLKLDTDELIRKGEWYSKPVYKQGFPGQPFPAAQQVWFSYWFEDAGKSKDNTKHEWKNTIDAIAYKKNFYTNPKGKNPYSAGELAQGLTESLNTVPDDLLDKDINGNIPEGTPVPNNGALGTLRQGNGVYIDEPPYVESLEVGANIKPLNPTLPVVSKDINIRIETPQASGPSINVAAPNVPATPTAPTVNVNVSVTPPSPIAEINVGAVTVTPPTPPRVDKIELSEVKPPQAFEPSIAVQPEAPEALDAPSEPDIPVIVTPIIPTVSGDANATGTGDQAWYWNPGGDLGPINQINITGGTFSALSSGSITGINITGYTGNPTTTNGTANYASSAGTTANQAGATATSNVGFYKWCGAPVIRLGSAATFNWAGDGTHSRALIKHDMHGNNATPLDTLLSGTSAETITAVEGAFVKDKIYPFIRTARANTSTSLLVYGVNYSTWNLSGSVINGYEVDGHGQTNRTVVFHNQGNITIVAGATKIAATAVSDNNGNNSSYITANGTTGVITINGNGNAIYYSKRNNNAQELNFLNYGTLIINGAGNAGVLLDGNSEEHSSIYFDKPLQIFGDGNIGVYFNNATVYNKNGIGGGSNVIKVNIGRNDSNVDQGESTVGSGNNNDGKINGNIGILNKTNGKDISVDHGDFTHEINIGVNTKGNIGVYSGNAAGSIFITGEGIVTIYGGEGNYGYSTGTGNLDTHGYFLLTGNDALSKNNIGAFASDTGVKLTLLDDKPDRIDSTYANGGNLGYVAVNNGVVDGSARTLTIEGKNNTGIYVADAGSSEVKAKKILLNGSGKNTGVFTTTGGTVNLGTGIEMTGSSDTGVFVKNTTLDGDLKKIEITGGSKNTGIFFSGNTSVITHVPNITISAGGGSAGFFSNNYVGNIQNLDISITSLVKGNVGVFAGVDTANSTIADLTLDSTNTIDLHKNGTTSGNNTGLFALGTKDGNLSNDGIINFGGTLNMDMDNNGIGYFASNEGQVNIDSGSTSTITNAGAAIAADQQGIIDLKSGATVDYDGNGYGVYFLDGNGSLPFNNPAKVKLNGTLKMKGNSTVIRRDWNDALVEAGVTSGTVGQKFDISGGTGKIDLQNDGITLFGFGNLAPTVNLTEIQTVTTALKNPLLTGTLVTNGHSYKDARLFDVMFNIDKNLTINGNTGTTAEKDGDYFKNYLALQRVNLTLKNAFNIDVDLPEDQLVGLALTSAYDSTPVAVTKTSITMEDGTSMTVDRTADTTNPSIVNKKNATGIYMNYGTVDIGQTTGATLKVNTTDPTKSEQAVGIYAENGAEVNVNTGSTVQVDGLNAIGIYGRPTRTGAKEFNGSDEGQITVINKGTVDMANADNSVGIYIDGQDPTAPGTIFGSLLINIPKNKATNNGTINTGKTDSAKDGFASGMYGSFATLDNQGQINANEKAAGIFAANSTVVSNVGNIDMADKAIGIVADESSYVASTALTSINVTATPGTDVSSAAGKSGTVLYLRSNAGASQDVITNNTSILNTAADKVTNIMADDIKLTNGVNQTVGDTGIGIVAINDAKVTNDTTATIDTTAANAIGLAATEKATLTNLGTIDFSGATANTSVGMLGSYDSTVTPTPAAPITMINEGEVKLAGADNAIGIYLTSDTASAIDLTTNINLTMNGTNLQQIGVYSLGENAIHLNATTGPATFSYANALNNILVYAKDGATIDTNGTQFTIDGTGSADGANGEKTIGIYLENAAKTNTFDSTATPLAVDGGAIGIYSKGGNTLNLGAAATPGLEVTGDTSVGAYIVGNDTISGAVTVTGTSAGNPVGVYNNGSTVTVATGGFGVNIDTAIGTGMYATNGGYFTGDKISITNTATDTNIGVYYTKGTGTSAAHDTDIDILAGQPAVGLYADGGIALSLAAGKTVDVQADKSIAAMVGGTSTFTNNGNLNLNTAVNAIGIYDVDGNGVNAAGSTITINNTDNMGMVAAADAGKTATIENAGTLAVQNGIGMVVGTPAVPGPASTGNSVGKNTGTIDVNTASGTGVVVTTGAQNTFDGTGGTINVNASAAGIYLDGTLSGQVANAGTVNLGNASAVGIFADNGAVVDFPVTVAGTKGVGVFADNGAQISGTIDASASTDTVAVFLSTDSSTVPPHNADGVVFLPNATIKTGANSSGTAIGILMNGLGASTNYALDNVTLEATNDNTLALALVDSKVDSTATMNLTNKSVGAYVGSTSELNFDGTMNLGTGSTGAFIDGGVGTLGMTGATVNFNGSGNEVAMFVANGGSVTLGSNITSTGKGSLAASENANLYNEGTLTVDNDAIGLVGVFDAAAPGFSSVPPYMIENKTTGDITVKTTSGTTGSIGMAAVTKTQTPGGAPVIPAAPGDVSLENNGHIAVQDSKSVGMYATVGTINNNGTVDVTNKGIGIYATENAAIGNIGTVNVTSGVGYVADGVNITPSGTLNLNNGTATDYSIGGYYKNINASITLPTVTAADYSITAAIDGGTNSVTGTVNGGSASGTNQIGVFVNGSTTPTHTTFHGITTTGDENIGVYVSDATIDGTGTITAAPSTASADKSKSSVGIYLNKGTLNAGSDTANVGDNSIGIYGKNANMTIGTVNTGDAAVGIYGSEGGQVAVTNGMTVGKGTLGAFGKGTDVSVTGPMTVDTDLGVGIVSEGTGNVDYTGAATVADKANSASIAIYKKDGQGTITTNAGSSFNVGKGGYAVYADASGATGPVTVNNNATISLNESSVGIYGSGPQTTVINNSDITVGDTYMFNADHSVSVNDLNSVALYGENHANVINNGTLTVDKDHSVGAYVITKSTFTNASTGVINVDNGGVGVLALGSTVNNEGVINTLYGLPTCEKGKSIGIAAYADASGTRGVVNNSGTINVGEGVGVYLGANTELNNAAGAKILIDKGIGVFGDGVINNNGTIEVIAGGSGSTTAQLNKTPVQQGAITIASTGEVIVNNQYVHLGGQFSVATPSPLELQNPLVDISGSLNKTQSEPYFTANKIEGVITLRPNFITAGNGYSWSVENFVTAAQNIGALDITVSPLFIAHMVTSSGPLDGTLSVVKQPYAYMVTGSQFDNLYNGVDSLLALDQSGTSSDSVVLKQLNAYLDQVYTDNGQQAFADETSRTLAEMRGDIYATTYKRMETIQNSFDNSFDELLNARNATKDSGKFSVIYQQGKYDDDTVGIDDYDYRVQGLMYMREYESRNYGSKHGYSVGFTVSRFDFDDAPTYGDKSKEDVYSLRAGLHNVHSFGEDGANDRLRLISRLELGYNRHEAVRTMELDKVYKNKGNYNSMNVSLDNKLEGTIYRDLKTDVVVYGAINLEYGYMGKFTERAKGDSALELTVKDQDYYSIEPEVGVDASRRAYLGKRLSAKVFGDLAYGYELGNYGEEHRKAKVNGGTEDYYELIKPAEEKGRIKATVGLTLEKPNGFGITGDVQLRKHQNKSSEDFRYGLRLNYTF